MDLRELVTGDFNEREIREAFSQLSSSNLKQRLDTLILCQDSVSRTAKMLSRQLALSIKSEDLKDELHLFIKHQESNDEDVRWLAIDLANNIEETVLIKNIEALIDYQESDDEDVRLLASDLALKIHPDKLVDKLDYFHQKCEESKNQLVCDLVNKLIKNASEKTRTEKVTEIIEMILA
jgi:hypothetical protein